MAKKISLSKSTVMRSLQCQKSLYLYKNNYKDRDAVSPEQQARFDRGHDVGHLAQKLFPGGKDLTPPSVFAYDQSIQATKLYVQMQTPVLYEAAFKALHTMVAIDIFTCIDGKYYAYEVKSNTQLKEVYIKDAALQYTVITNSGVKLEDMFLITLKNMDFDIEQQALEDIFEITSIKDKVEELYSESLDAINNAITTLSSESCPNIAMGDHCHNPYPCDFIGWCTKNKAL